jgi:transposase
MPFAADPVALSEEEKTELEQMTQSRTLPAGDVMRARMVLLLAGGTSYQEIQKLLDTTAPTIARWKDRFLRHGIAGLVEERHPGQKPSVRTPRLQARVLAAIKEGPKDGATHWSCRKLATHLRVGKDTIQRILSQADVRPHRLARYMASDDPDFETKAADVIGLYLSPPQHAAVFCVDEKTAIQALDRLDPVLPLSPGRVERHGFEYRRNGTLSLYAALDVKTGKVRGKTAERHTSAEFVGFLGEVVSGCKPGQEIHIILDNLSAHKTKKVDEFLEDNPNVKLHFTPTYSSWLNQVEIWFARLEREVIARGIFTSVHDLARKLMRYIRAYSKTARPFKWKYNDVRRRILPC